MTVPPVDLFPAELHMRKVCAVDVVRRRLRGGRDAGCWRRCTTSARRCCTASGRCPTRRCRACSTALYTQGPAVLLARGLRQRAHRRARSRSTSSGAQKLPSMHSTMHMYPIDGAAHDVGPADTAFSYRDAKFAEVIFGVDPDPANADDDARLVRRLLGRHAPVLGRRRLRQLHDGGGPGAGAARRTAATTTASRGSRRSTTRTTCSASTRTSSPPRRLGSRAGRRASSPCRALTARAPARFPGRRRPRSPPPLHPLRRAPPGAATSAAARSAILVPWPSSRPPATCSARKDLADARYFEPLERRRPGARRRPLARALQPRVPARVRRVAARVPADAPARARGGAAAHHRPLGRRHLPVGRAAERRLVHHELHAHVRRCRRPPTARRSRPPPRTRVVPACVVRVYGRPQHRTFREDSAAAAPSVAASTVPPEPGGPR